MSLPLEKLSDLTPRHTIDIERPWFSPEPNRQVALETLAEYFGNNSPVAQALQDHITNPIAAHAASAISAPATGSLPAGRVSGQLAELNSVQDSLAWSDHSRGVFGREYLARVYNRLMSRDLATIISTGDSTKAGGGAHSTRYTLNISDILRDNFNVTVTNTGVGGTRTYDWIGVSPSAYPAGGLLAADLALNPDLYIVGWPSPNDVISNGGVVWTTEQTMAAFETGLQTIRAAKTVSEMSVLVVADAAMFDPVNGRDDAWFRAINAQLRELCREYECAFVDLYALGTAVGGAGIWYDDPFADGRAIHPLDNFNLVITSAVVDAIVPTTLRSSYGAARVRNLSAASGVYLPGPTGSGIPRGIAITNALAADGWPFDGTLVSFNSADQRAVQILSERATGSLRFRASEVGTAGHKELNLINSEATLDVASAPNSFGFGWHMRATAASEWPAGCSVVWTFAPRGGSVVQVACGVGSMAIRTGSGGSWGAFSRQVGSSTEAANFTAVRSRRHVVTANATATDFTSPADGDWYEVLVLAGTATVGGVGYSTPGQLIIRARVGGAWVSHVK